MTDYFRKWLEVKAFSSVKDKDVVQFIWKNIVYRFGIPQSIVTDNGPQFDSRVYRNFCNELKNQELVFNRTVSTKQRPGKIIQQDSPNSFEKASAFGHREMVDELPGVLWAYRTTSRKPTGMSPFPVMYGMKAIIPTKIGMHTLSKDQTVEFSLLTLTKVHKWLISYWHSKKTILQLIACLHSQKSRYG